jgi:hypothetical protein
VIVGEILQRKVDWKNALESAFIFSAVVDGQTFKLRMNDFPEEPLCTLIWADGQQQDLEDLGKRWTLPAHRGE